MRVIRLILAATIAATPVAVPPAVATAAPKTATVNKVDSQQEAMVLLADLVAWSRPASDLITQTTDLGLSMVNAMGEAAELDKSGAEGRAWAAAWQERTDAELARLKLVAAGLQPMPANLKARFLSLDAPDVQRQVEGFSAVPNLARGLLRDTESLLEVARELIGPAAGGDEKAKLELTRKMLSGTRLMLKGEVAAMDLGIASTNDPGHPQVGIYKASKASNEALIEVLGYVEESLTEAALSEETTPDAAAAGRVVAAKAAEAKKAALQIWPNAQRATSILNRQVPSGEMITAINKAMATYEESGRVELAIANVLDKVATNLMDDPEKIDVEAWPLEDLEPLVARRMALQEQRVALFRGS